jgi:hypothetical protein
MATPRELALFRTPGPAGLSRAPGIGFVCTETSSPWVSALQTAFSRPCAAELALFCTAGLRPGSKLGVTMVAGRHAPEIGFVSHESAPPRCADPGVAFSRNQNIVSRQDAKNAKKTLLQWPYLCDLGVFARNTIPWISISHARCFPKSSREKRQLATGERRMFRAKTPRAPRNHLLSSRPLTVRVIPSFITAAPKFSRNPSFRCESFR